MGGVGKRDGSQDVGSEQHVDVRSSVRDSGFAARNAAIRTSTGADVLSSISTTKSTYDAFHAKDGESGSAGTIKNLVNIIDTDKSAVEATAEQALEKTSLGNGMAGGAALAADALEQTHNADTAAFGLYDNTDTTDDAVKKLKSTSNKAVRASSREASKVSASYQAAKKAHAAGASTEEALKVGAKTRWNKSFIGSKTTKAKSKLAASTYRKTKNTARAAAIAKKSPKAIFRAMRQGGVNVFKALIAAAGAALVPVTIILVIVIILAIILSMFNTSKLSDVEREIAVTMRTQGYTTEAIAAALGNCKAESGCDPNALHYNDVEPTGGLFQWFSGNYYALLSFAAEREKPWTDVETQIDFMFGEGYGQIYTDWKIYHLNNGSYWDCNGYPGLGVGYRSAEEFKNADDVDLATYSFMACYERCNYTENEAHLGTRIQYAREYYSWLTSGDYGDEFTSEEGKRIVEASERVDSPDYNLCATWVSMVYREAGLGYPAGDANTMYYNYCYTSDRDLLQPGMIVAVDVNNNGGIMGKLYGHVGIYVGNGYVRESVYGMICDTPIDDWIAWYATGSVVAKWGWAY